MFIKEKEMLHWQIIANRKYLIITHYHPIHAS